MLSLLLFEQSCVLFHSDISQKQQCISYSNISILQMFSVSFSSAELLSKNH